MKKTQTSIVQNNAAGQSKSTLVKAQGVTAVNAQAGMFFQLVDTVTDQLVKPKKFRRFKKNLVVEMESGETVEINDFFDPRQGQHAKFILATGKSQSSLTLIDASSTSDSPSTNADEQIYWLPDMQPGALLPLHLASSLLGASDALLAAGAVGFGLVGNGSFGKGSQAPTVEGSIVKGGFWVGPALTGNGLIVVIYDLNGCELGREKLSNNEAFSINVGQYTGGFLVKVSDMNTANDCVDEGLGEGEILGDAMVFMAVSQIPSINATVTVHVNAATTVAAVKAGLSAKDGSGTIRGGTDAEKIATIVAANAAVAQIAGVTGVLVEATAKSTIDTTGKLDANANALRKFLAAVSGMDVANNGNMAKSVESLAKGISTSNHLSTLSSGAQAAIIIGVINSNEASKEMASVIDISASSKAQSFNSANASALNPATAVLLTPAQVAAINDVSQIPTDTMRVLAPAQLLALTPSQLAALSPAQVAALSPSALTALSPATHKTAQLGALTAVFAHKVVRFSKRPSSFFGHPLDAPPTSSSTLH
jgi:hypothetical protein